MLANVVYRFNASINRRFIMLALTTTLASCQDTPTSDEERASKEHVEITQRVTATAFTSAKSETDNTPNITAWGDRLEPGMKAIAVSRDLIALGLNHRTEVSIEGMPGTYLVLDKMNKRWQKKIDIYMGEDAAKAKKWGKREVVISWKKPSSPSK